MNDKRQLRVRPSPFASRRDCLALPLLMMGVQGALAQHRPSADKPHSRLTADSTIGDMVSHLASDHAPSEPPTFALVGDQDGIAPPAAMRQRVAALRRIGTDVDYREYPRLGHGFGLGIGTSAEGWINEAIRFWTRHQSR